MRAVGIFIILIVITGLQSCCMPQHAKLYETAKLYYTSNGSTINGRHFIIKDLSIINVRKYTCDSVAAYTRIKGVYEGSRRKSGFDFDVARRLTMVKGEGNYYVVNEVEER